MNGIVNFLIGGASNLPSRSAEQEEMNLAVALSLSESEPQPEGSAGPAKSQAVGDESPTPKVEDTSNDVAIAQAMTKSGFWGDQIQQGRTALEEKTEDPQRSPPFPQFHALASIPSGLRNSIMLLQEDANNDKAVAEVLQHEDDMASPTNIEVGGLFDEKIEKHVSKFRLPSMTGIFYPSVNKDTTDNRDTYRQSKRRLKSRLDSYQLVEYHIAGDGNCQFSSLSDQLYRSPKLTGVVRAMVVKQLKTGAEEYSRFVPGDYDEYCDKMAKNGTWGDHLTLQAAADRFGTQINLITSYKDTPFVEIRPQGELNSSRILWLSFFGELHYNSLYTYEDIEYRRKMDRPTAECILF